MPLSYIKHLFILIIATSVTHFLIQKLFDCSPNNSKLVNQISEKVETSVIHKIQRLAQKENKFGDYDHVASLTKDHIEYQPTDLKAPEPTYFLEKKRAEVKETTESPINEDASEEYTGFDNDSINEPTADDQFDSKQCRRFLTSGKWNYNLRLDDYQNCYGNKNCRENAWNYNSGDCEVVHFDRQKFKECLNEANFFFTSDSRIRQQYYTLKSIIENGDGYVEDPKNRDHSEFTVNNNKTKTIYIWDASTKDTTGTLTKNLPMDNSEDQEFTVNPNNRHNFIIGSSWLWEVMRFKLIFPDKEKPIEEDTNLEDHYEFARNYSEQYKTLKPLIEKVREKYPDTKFLTDAPAWRMSGYQVMLRNFASDLTDELLEPFWNDGESLKDVGYYSAGKKNSFAKGFRFPKPFDPPYVNKTTGEEFKFHTKDCFADTLPWGLNYYGKDGYHKMSQRTKLKVPMNIYLDLNYYFNYFCDTRKWVSKPCCNNF